MYQDTDTVLLQVCATGVRTWTGWKGALRRRMTAAASAPGR
jgi:hypothetical protein